MTSILTPSWIRIIPSYHTQGPAEIERGMVPGAGLVATVGVVGPCFFLRMFGKVTTFGVVKLRRFLEFSPRKFGEDVQFDEYFSDGLKPPTRFFLMYSYSKLHNLLVSMWDIMLHPYLWKVFLAKKTRPPFLLPHFATKNWKESNFPNGFNVRITSVDWTMFTFI